MWFGCGGRVGAGVRHCGRGHFGGTTSLEGWATTGCAAAMHLLACVGGCQILAHEAAWHQAQSIVCSAQAKALEQCILQQSLNARDPSDVGTPHAPFPSRPGDPDPLGQAEGPLRAAAGPRPASRATRMHHRCLIQRVMHFLRTIIHRTRTCTQKVMQPFYDIHTILHMQHQQSLLCRCDAPQRLAQQCHPFHSGQSCHPVACKRHHRPHEHVLLGATGVKELGSNKDGR